MKWFILFIFFVIIISSVKVVADKKAKEQEAYKHSLEEKRKEEIRQREELERQEQIKQQENAQKARVREALKKDLYKMIAPEYNKCDRLVESFVVIDLETTGLEWYECEIIEIGAIKYDNCEESDRFHSYIKPVASVPSRITQITGITNEMLTDAPDLKSVLPELQEFLSDYVLVAHNAPFDMKFLQNSFDNALNTELDNEVIDTLPLARQYLKQLGSHKLEVIKRHFGLEFGSHNAMDDCSTTAKLYTYCLEQSKKPDYQLDRAFVFDEDDFTDFENAVYTSVSEIVSDNGLENLALRMNKTSKYTEILYIREPIIRFSGNTKTKYILISEPIEQFTEKYGDGISLAESPKSEKAAARYIIDNPADIREIEEYIVDCYILGQNKYNANKKYYK